MTLYVKFMDMEKIKIFNHDFMNPLFTFLENTKDVEQSVIHHPEGDVFTHSLQVLRWAFRESHDTDLILAAMLHDIGKKEQPLGHEDIACEWLDPYVSVKTLWLIKNHMRIWYYLTGDMRKLGKCKELAGHPWLPELIQLARWDKMGRVPGVTPKYDKCDIVDRLNKKIPLHFSTV